jgi:mannose-6-phosphate isomerase-like protein (cupin superfamily)
VEHHDLDRVDTDRSARGRLYQEFLRQPGMSAGWYVLPAGAIDPQGPHTEDEIYHVVRGRATIRVGDETSPVGPGSVVFVPALVPHRFEAIEEELGVLVVFVPAEYSRAAARLGEEEETRRR